MWMSSFVAIALLAQPAAPAAAKPAAKAPAPAAKTPAKPAPATKAAEPTPAPPVTTPVAVPAPAAPAAKPMEPEVKRLVDLLQGFYEKTADFEAKFAQTYTYTMGRRAMTSSGTMLFKKPALMRWDYEKPSLKSIVVAGGAVYMYDSAAAQLTKAPLQMDKLSASVTFLWGQGKLADEFDITRTERPELKGGVALELIPKRPDPRFDRLFFLVDEKSGQVKETIVVDPDGSTNHMVFSGSKVDQKVGPERFKLDVPEGTHAQDLTKMGSQPAAAPAPEAPKP